MGKKDSKDTSQWTQIMEGLKALEIESLSLEEKEALLGLITSKLPSLIRGVCCISRDKLVNHLKVVISLL